MSQPHAALATEYYKPSRISAKLWQGSAPPVGPYLARAGVANLILMAEEHQPGIECFPGVRVLHAPIADDDRLPTPEESVIVEYAARDVAASVLRGERTLVTCWMGLNRSGLVVARALMLMHDLPADRAIAIVRAGRSSKALSNQHFVEYLRRA